MGKIGRLSRVKLITGFIFKDELIFHKVKTYLVKHFGKIDFESDTLEFNRTKYYEREFGNGLKRKFAGFTKLISPQNLAKIKILTNKIETKFSINGWRTINIDPGYLNLSKLVLATTKDYTHRIYLNYGIFAEVTLFYQNKTFTPYPWTYPDYQSADYINIFNRIRKIYNEEVKEST